MNSYIVTLQLGYPENNYVNLIAYLKSNHFWARPMANVWVIKSDKIAMDIRDEVISKINTHLGDKVMVVLAEKRNWGTCNVVKDVNDWLKNKL